MLQREPFHQFQVTVAQWTADLTTWDTRVELTHRPQAERIEGLHGDRPPVPAQRRDHRAFKTRRRLMRFQFQKQRDLTLHDLQDLREQRDVLVRAEQAEPAESMRRGQGDQTNPAGEAGQTCVMADHRTVVTADPHVELDRDTGPDRRLDCRKRVLRPSGVSVVKTTMCCGDGSQPVGFGSTPRSACGS